MALQYNSSEQLNTTNCIATLSSSLYLIVFSVFPIPDGISWPGALSIQMEKVP